MAENQKRQEEVRAEFRAEQSKYVYFLLAAAGSAIAVAINWTKGHVFSFSLIPAGLAVLAWGYSFYCGCKFMNAKLNVLFKNHQYFEVVKGNDPDIGSNPEHIKIAEQKIKSIIQRDANVATKWFDRQFKALITGAVIFILWHVLELYFQTNPQSLLWLAE